MEILRDEVPAASRKELEALATAGGARERGNNSVSALEERVYEAVWRSMQRLSNARRKPWAVGVTLLGFVDSWVEDPIQPSHSPGVAEDTTFEV
jgi:hypothetical protein